MEQKTETKITKLDLNKWQVQHITTETMTAGELWMRQNQLFGESKEAKRVMEEYGKLIKAGEDVMKDLQADMKENQAKIDKEREEKTKLYNSIADSLAKTYDLVPRQNIIDQTFYLDKLNEETLTKIITDNKIDYKPCKGNNKMKMIRAILEANVKKVQEENKNKQATVAHTTVEEKK